MLSKNKVLVFLHVFRLFNSIQKTNKIMWHINLDTIKPIPLDISLYKVIISNFTKKTIMF